MLKGKLYMIPTTLGECDVEKILPMYVKEHLHNLEEFIVENSKTARAFLKKMNIPTPQNKLKIHVADFDEILDFSLFKEFDECVGFGLVGGGMQEFYVNNNKGILVSTASSNNNLLTSARPSCLVLGACPGGHG